MVGLESFFVLFVNIGFFDFKLSFMLINVLIIVRLFVFVFLIVDVIFVIFVMFGESFI